MTDQLLEKTLHRRTCNYIGSLSTVKRVVDADYQQVKNIQNNKSILWLMAAFIRLEKHIASHPSQNDSLTRLKFQSSIRYFCDVLDYTHTDMFTVAHTSRYVVKQAYAQEPAHKSPPFGESGHHFAC